MPTTVPDAMAVRAAVARVPDPELPPVTIGMLGMIHDIVVDPGGGVTVELLPTFSGCPATEMIGRDVEQAVGQVPGVRRVEVRFRFTPAWSSERINAEGRRALATFGIAPPTGENARTAHSPTNDAPDPHDRTLLPLASAPPVAARPTPCPYCGSSDTVRDSHFGPTPCRAVHYCQACRQPFEAFKDL